MGLPTVGDWQNAAGQVVGQVCAPLGLRPGAFTPSPQWAMKFTGRKFGGSVLGLPVLVGTCEDGECVTLGLTLPASWSGLRLFAGPPPNWGRILALVRSDDDPWGPEPVKEEVTGWFDPERDDVAIELAGHSFVTRRDRTNHVHQAFTPERRERFVALHRVFRSIETWDGAFLVASMEVREAKRFEFPGSALKVLAIYRERLGQALAGFPVAVNDLAAFVQEPGL